MVRNRLFKPLIILLLFIIPIGVVRAAVDLMDFSARVSGNVIILRWETASELDNSGFYLQRSTVSGSGYTRISDFIPTEAEGATGATYVYTDTTVVLGPVYYYKLEQVDLEGNSVFSGPIIATLNPNTPTATRTATATPPNPTKTATSTLTHTPTSLSNVTLTPTRSPTNNPTTTKTGIGTPSKTPIYYPPTPTVRTKTATSTVFSGDITATEPYSLTTATVTPTLIPLPKLTLLYPATATRIKNSATPSHTPTETQPPPSVQNVIVDKLPPKWRVVGGVIILIWLLLGLFLIAYTRRLSRL